MKLLKGFNQFDNQLINDSDDKPIKSFKIYSNSDSFRT